MNKILVTVISVSLLTNVRGSAEVPGDRGNVSLGQPPSEVSSVDPIERLVNLETITKHLLEKVARLEQYNQILTGQNRELHSRLQKAQAWIDAEQRRKESLGVQLKALRRFPQPASAQSALGELTGATGWHAAAGPAE